MSSGSLFNVPAAVLLDQAAFTMEELRGPNNRPTLQAMRKSGFDVDDFVHRFESTLQRALDVHTRQEKSKALVNQEREEDRTLAEAGYRWIRSLHARLRLADARGMLSSVNIGRTFRFGVLRAPRVRGVLTELRVQVAELDKVTDDLSAVGITPTFREQGRALLDNLTRDRAETADATSRRAHLTQELRELEEKLIALIRELRAMRSVVNIDTDKKLPGFSLTKLRAYAGRPPRSPQEVAEEEDDDDPLLTLVAPFDDETYDEDIEGEL